MSVFKRFDSEDYHWGIWKQEETLEELLAMLPCKGKMYESQLEHFLSGHRKKEWLAVRVLLYLLMGEQKKVGYYENGRPYLTDDSAHISISHTKGYVAVILSEKKRVGIDIEVLGERVRKVAHKFVATGEISYPYDDELTEIEALTLVWSAKEVMFKCMNQSGVDFRQHLHTDINSTLFTRPYFDAVESCTPDKRRFYMHYMLQPGEFAMTWTSML